MSGQAFGGDRNHYFTGKLMTVRDFELEQRYMIDRRRLLSRLLHGAGVVSGLRVLRLDDQTFSLEPGVALDGLGREIIVEEPCVRRLSTVEGFEACGDTAYLCLRYREEPREETFSAATAATGSLEPEFNCVHEGYELYVTPEAPRLETPEDLWRQTVTLHSGEGLRLAVILPRYVRPGGLLQGSVRFEKRGRAAPAHYRLTLAGDLFSTAQVRFDETETASDREDEQTFTLRCTASGGAVGTIRAEQISVRCGGVEVEPPGQAAELEVTSLSAAQAVVQAYFGQGFSAGEAAGVCLARLRLISDKSACYLEQVECNPQLVASTALLQLLHTLPGDDGARQSAAAAEEAAGSPPPRAPEGRAATGVETISLGLSPKPGRDYYSGEIVHGLGYGTVAVVAALCNQPAPLSGEEEVLLFGDAGLFQDEKFPHTLPRVRLGVMAAPGRGTLRLGVHLLEKTGRQTLDVRWWAFRREGEEAGKPLEERRVTVRVTPNTVSLPPLGQARLSALVEGETDQEVLWSVTDPEGGSVDQNGVYLAPAGEGVFEVSARSARHEEARGCAYIVVHDEETEAERS